MSITVEDYLSKSNPEKYKGISKRYTMKSSYGMEAMILNYGALVEKLFVPDSSGNLADVMLGLKGLDDYMESGANHGSVVGRSANRIKDASFVINGETYNIPKNEGPNNLHSGNPGYSTVFWDGKIISREETDAFIKGSGISGIPEADGESLLLSYTSPDGATGFPGNLDTNVLYAWLVDGTLLIMYKGTTDKDTIFAPTNHSYFNLRGQNSGLVSDHLLMVNADKVTVKDELNCPNGEYMDVEGTCFDFREPKPISQALDTDEPQVTMSVGLDQNFCLNDSQDGNKYAFAASVCDPITNRIMDVYTDLPGLQAYAGCHIAGTKNPKGDVPYVQYGAICLEAQMYPNAVNIPEFKSPVIKAGVPCYHACGYRFKA